MPIRRSNCSASTSTSVSFSEKTEMGVSTNAILAFGFDLGEELPRSLHDPDSEERFDFLEFIRREAGLEPYQAGGDITAYLKASDDLEAAFPVDIVEHCSAGCPMYFLAFRGTVQIARRGYPEKVMNMHADPILVTAKVEAFRAFCDKHGIEGRAPKWHLFSYWDQE